MGDVKQLPCLRPATPSYTDALNISGLGDGTCDGAYDGTYDRVNVEKYIAKPVQKKPVYSYLPHNLCSRIGLALSTTTSALCIPS